MVIIQISDKVYFRESTNNVIIDFVWFIMDVWKKIAVKFFLCLNGCYVMAEKFLHQDK